jgi:uncharacterized protein (DUF1800 family)
VATILFSLPIIAQELDPNPDSPTPIIITENDNIRALANDSKTNKKLFLKKPTSQAFSIGKENKMVIYVANLDLLQNEGADAFRFFLENGKGKVFYLPVDNINKLQPNLWAVTINLFDPIAYWGQPEENGDMLGYLTWRGLMSNQVKIGLGTTGGDIKVPETNKPMPMSVTQTPKSKTDVNPNYVGYLYSGDRARFIEQATFGTTSALDNRIRRIGLRTWLAEQFEAPYPSLAYPDVPLKPSTPLSDCDNDQTIVPDVPPTCNRDVYTSYLLQTWFMKEAFYGNPQLRHRVAWSLSQIWVTSGNDIQQSSHSIAYYKILANNAFGNWRNLMQEMTLNPAMGEYLDMVRSTKNSPNENYPREILQLFNIGLFMLNQNGTVQTDGLGNPIPSYDQNTVNNFTKVFTGWSFCQNQTLCPSWVSGTVNYKDPMLLNSANHDITAKTLFTYPGSTTTNIAACTGCTGTTLTNYANNSLNQALDNIFNHPNVPPFVSKLLIQQMVTSDPTPAYVQRVANVFANNGFGVRGDMKAVIKAILLDPEARGNVKTDPRYGKLREPLQYATNVLKTFNVQSADGTTTSDGNISGNLSNMSQNPFRSPTVFNYYSPDYVVPGTTVLGPEFGILTTSTTIQRSNFINTMVYSRINGGSTNFPNGTSIRLTELQALAAADTTGNQLVDALNNKLMHGTMSAQMKSSILTAVTAITTTNTLARAQTALYLVATSSQYQIQR